MWHHVLGAPVLDTRGWPDSGGAGGVESSRVGIERPEVLGGAGLRHPSLRGPEKGLLKEILLIEGAGTKVLGRPHVLPEAGGQVGVVPVAVSWE